jgi:hypothetical protein
LQEAWPSPGSFENLDLCVGRGDKAPRKRCVSSGEFDRAPVGLEDNEIEVRPACSHPHRRGARQCGCGESVSRDIYETFGTRAAKRLKGLSSRPSPMQQWEAVILSVVLWPKCDGGMDES